MSNFTPMQGNAGVLPTFGADPISSTGQTNYQTVADRSGLVWTQSFRGLSAQFGDWAQASFRADMENAGRMAGMRSDYRPEDAPIIQRAAYQKAALKTYGDQLETKTRTVWSDGLDAYMKLPADQRDPAKFKEQMEAQRQEILKHDVFPEAQPQFQKAWDSLALTVNGAARDDLDRRTLESAKASNMANAKAAADMAHRVASLPGPEADKQVEAQLAAHDKLIDDGVNQGVYTAPQAETLKSSLRDQVGVTRGLALFSSVPDAEKPAYLAKFQARYSGDFASMVRAKESGGNDAAQSTTSSAAGRYGFTAGTWQDLVAKHPELHLSADGRLDPAQQEKAFAALTADNKTALEAAGHAGTPANLYMAHFLGTGGAKDFLGKLAKDPTASAPAAFPKEAASNRAVFYNPDGSARSLQEVYNLQTRDFGGANPTAGQSHGAYLTLVGQMERQVRAVEAQAQTAQRSAVADLAAAKRQIAGGDDLTPAAWSDLSRKYAASPDPEIRQAFEQTSAVRSVLTSFTGQKPEVVEAKIATMQATLEGGASAGQVELVKDAREWLGRYREDIAKDPIGRYARDYGAAVPPLDLSAPAALATSLAARAPIAEQAAAVYGLPAARYLMPDDKAAFKTIAANGGPQMVQTAGALMSALGPRGADVLREIGDSAPAFVTAARVAAWGGDPGFLADFGEWQRLSNDPATRKAMELPRRDVADRVINEAFGQALLALPDLNAGARVAGVQTFEVRALRNGFDKGLSDSAATAALARTAQQALGATYDGAVQYGGVGARSLGFLRGSEQLLAPGNMRADMMGDAIASLTDDDLKALPAQPFYADNRPATARAIAGSRLVSVGRGKYRVASGDPLSDDTTYLKTADGAPFVLDLNALEDRLRARLPGLYK